jgi:hypothetical protein
MNAGRAVLNGGELRHHNSEAAPPGRDPARDRHSVAHPVRLLIAISIDPNVGDGLCRPQPKAIVQHRAGRAHGRATQKEASHEPENQQGPTKISGHNGRRARVSSEYKTRVPQGGIHVSRNQASAHGNPGK